MNNQDPTLDRSLRRWEAAGAVVFFLLVLSFPLYRMAEASDRNETNATRETALVAMGKKVFADNCAKCHGDNGEGVDSPALHSKQFFEEATPERIEGLVRVGIPGTTMQTWAEDLGGPLTDEQIAAVAAYIYTWEEGAPDIPDWRTYYLGTPPPMNWLMANPRPSATASPSAHQTGGQP